MKNNFLKASEYKVKKERRSSVKCNAIMKAMNFKIERGQDRIWLNTGDRGIPFLNENEIEWLTKEAKKQDWKFVAQDDNYNTTTYIITPEVKQVDKRSSGKSRQKKTYFNTSVHCLKFHL